jgi:probable DNA metabolism protein
MIVHYDGTLAGLLTVCRRSEFSGEEEPAQIQRPPYPAPGLFDEIVEVATDGQLAAELRERIGRELSPRSADNIRLAFLSEHPGIEAAIWRYLALGRKVGRRLDCCLAHPDVHAVHCWARRTAHEGHRLRGLARFRDTADGTLYAPFQADANVLPLLAPHFARRFDRPWVLHDVRRSLGAIGTDGRYLLGTLVAPAKIPWAQDEGEFQALWRAFHRHIAIPDRISPRRQRQFMPMKYWEYLVEMQEAG